MTEEIKNEEMQEQNIPTTENVKEASKAATTSPEPEEDFDWEAFEKSEVFGTTRTELEEMYAKTLSTIAEKEVIDGTVISMNKREVVINIGYKSDGIVSLNEFRYNPELKIGDKV